MQGHARRSLITIRVIVKYKLVIFDFDGTLANSFPLYATMLNTVADIHGLRHIEPHELEMAREISEREIFRRLRIPWWKVPFIIRTVNRLALENASRISLFNGVDEMLQQLSTAGATLAVVTTNSCSTAKQVLGPENVRRIDDFECKASLFGKQARFRRILKRTGFLPHEALSIGDQLRDLEASKKANIPFGAVAWGFTPIEVFQEHAPDELFVGVEEIAERVMDR